MDGGKFLVRDDGHAPGVCPRHARPHGERVISNSTAPSTSGVQLVNNLIVDVRPTRADAPLRSS